MSGLPLDAVRAGLSDRRAWIVGGAVRDALLGRETGDLDLAVAGDVPEAAAAVARATGAPRFPLSEAFGAWRVTDREGRWQVDLSPLAGEAIEDDLARRDFTVNAIAEPLAGGDLVDPHGGREDLDAGRLRMVSAAALADDPLRALRAARFATELSLEVDPLTAAAVREHAEGLGRVSAERIWVELRGTIGAPDPVRGIRLLGELGLTSHVLPELAALHGVEQSAYHHLDVFEHTLAVLEQVVALERAPASGLGDDADVIAAQLAEPLADGLSRWGALRLAALLHDAAKPGTRVEFPDGRVGFPGHDGSGAALAREVLTRLKTSERLRAHVAALVREHLRLGFLVHRRPLSRREIHAYLSATRPVSVDVTVLTVADRLATRGRNSEPAIAAHLALAHDMLAEAVAPAPAGPLVRGDELARALDLQPGPLLGRLLAELEEARFAGEIASPEEAVAHGRRWLERQ